MFGALFTLSLLLLVVDSATGLLGGPRRAASVLLLPIHVLADAPARFGRFVDDSTGSRASLLGERDELRAEAKRLALELQRLAVLESENGRLRLLLESKRRLALKVRAAEIIGVVPNPATRQILVDKGGRDGAYVGQPVVDADGVVGQVVDVTPISSRVMQLTDIAHALPATVVRSGLRVVVAGTGEPDVLEVRHVTESSDLAEGDLLITSGLDQRFPAGYPVARVVTVDRESGGAFVRVRAVPLANLERETHVLMVFTPPPPPLPPRVREAPTLFALPPGFLPKPGVPAQAEAPTAEQVALVCTAYCPGADGVSTAPPAGGLPAGVPAPAVVAALPPARGTERNGAAIALPPVQSRSTLPFAPPPAPSAGGLPADVPNAPNSSPGTARVAPGISQATSPTAASPRPSVSSTSPADDEAAADSGEEGAEELLIPAPTAHAPAPTGAQP